MNTKIIIALVAIVGIFGLTGCKPKTTTLTGQVFIATRGGDNVKFGDVEILLIEKSQVTDFLEKRQPIIGSEIASRQQALSVAEEDAQKAQLAFDSFLKHGRPTTNSDLIEILKQSDAVKKEVYAANKQIDAVSGQIDALEANPQAWNPAWNTRTDALFNEQDALLKKDQSYVDELKLLSLKFDAVVARLDAEETNKLNSAKLCVVSAEQKLEYSPTSGDYLSDFLPVAAQRTISDADGKFSLVYPHGQTFTIYAHAQRATLNGIEDYYWLIDAPKNAEVVQVFLSNNDLVSVDPDGYFKIKPK
jgi:hypothetical protein